jgi:RNA polymerase sigma factor (sigma-70 family)
LELHDESLSERLSECAGPVQTDVEDLLSLDDALTELQKEDEQLAKLVELRYFVGMTIDDTAQVLGVSPRTVKRNWTYARAWLKRQMDGNE